VRDEDERDLAAQAVDGLRELLGGSAIECAGRFVEDKDFTSNPKAFAAPRKEATECGYANCWRARSGEYGFRCMTQML